MEKPSITSLPAPEREVAQGIARRLREAGHGAWIVGGAVRDLALGWTVHDVDLATPARPEEVEELFAVTHAVGKAFGTIIVVERGFDVQVTTFRAEGTYHDGRHPSAVDFGIVLEEDARRRDFTCNAIYLDPLTDELRDPVGGLADLARGRLRCVGAAQERFAEDGLRLLRLARFAAVYGLAVEAETLAAARAAADSLGGVSVERVYAELATVAEQGAAAAALRLLAETDLLCAALPGLQGLHPPELTPAEAMARRLAALDRFGDRRDVAGVLALLFDPRDPEREAQALECLARLRPPRVVLERVERLWRLAGSLARVGGAAPTSSWRARAARIRLVQDPEWGTVADLARAWDPHGGGGAAVAELETWAARLTDAERRPDPLLTSADLGRLGLAPGPRWGELLREAEDRQLGGALGDRAAALRWLAAEVASEGS